MKKNFFPNPAADKPRLTNNFILFQNTTKVYKALEIVFLNNAILTIEAPDVVRITANNENALIFTNRDDGQVDRWEYYDGQWLLNGETQ